MNLDLRSGDGGAMGPSKARPKAAASGKPCLTPPQAPALPPAFRWKALAAAVHLCPLACGLVGPAWGLPMAAAQLCCLYKGC